MASIISLSVFLVLAHLPTPIVLLAWILEPASIPFWYLSNSVSLSIFPSSSKPIEPTKPSAVLTAFVRLSFAITFAELICLSLLYSGLSFENLPLAAVASIPAIESVCV